MGFMRIQVLKEQIRQVYGLAAIELRQLPTGVGGEAFFVETAEGRYIFKRIDPNGMNHPEAEPALCAFLQSKGIPVSSFVPTLDRRLVWPDGDRFCHLQDFIDGTTVNLNTASDTLLAESAQLLGRIHAALSDYPALPTGIGEDFFKHMTPARAEQSYRHSLDIAREKGDADFATDLLYRIRRMERFPYAAFDLNRLTCRNTHGDYTISNLICRGGRIQAVIDWTAACVHPVIWEILRSFLYASPACREGEIDVEGLVGYVREYRKHHALTTCDLESMPHLFHYQIAVCDYYGQYYGSDAANRGIFAHQARFSTRLMRWFETNADRLSERLSAI